jgi:3-methylfumaryl-CoA hydratase
MTPVTTAQIQEWQSAVGRTQTRTEVLDPESLRRYAAAIGEDLEVERAHPSLGHWAYFQPLIANSDLTLDGASRGTFLPSISLPRRMFAGATFRFGAPLRLGRAARMVSTIAELKHKSGRSGDLVFIEVEDVISQENAVCVAERRTIVYRDAGAPPAAVTAAPISLTAQEELWQPGPIDLFRFSAATFNSHRIHYDTVYTREDEGYPGLLVQGPFTAAKLFGYARRRAGRQPRIFSFRAELPLYVSQPVRLTADDGAAVAAIRCDGATAMTASASFDEPGSQASGR